MRVISIRIRNYASYRGEHEFVFTNRGLVLVLGRNLDEPRMNNNASGKTSLFDSLDWCQNGKVPSGDHVDSIINDFEDEAEVTTYYDDEGISRVVQRNKRRGKSVQLKYWVGDRQVTALDTDELQKIIWRDLGLDRDVFHAAVFYGQRDTFGSFAKATDAQAMDILTQILGLEDIDKMMEHLKAATKVTEESIQKTKMEISVAEGALSALSEQLVRYQQQIPQWENERAEQLRKATVQLNEYLADIARTKEFIATYEDKVYAMQSVYNPMGATSYDWSSFQKVIADAKALETQWTEKVAWTKSQMALLNQKRAKMQSLTDTICPECGAPVSKEHIERELQNLDSELGRLTTECRSDDKSLVQAAQYRQAKEAELENAKKLHMQAEEDAKEKAREAESLKREVDQAKAYLSKAEPHTTILQSVMADTHAKKNPWREQCDAVQKDMQAQQQRLDEAKDHLDGLNESAKYYAFWKKGLGPTGLKNYILDSRLQEMNEAANYWVQLITGGTFWVRIETQKMGRSTRRLTNKFNVRVFRYNPDGTISDRNLKTWSGGESARIVWAVDFGLSRLIASRATKSWDMMVLDEVFSHVDEAGGDAIMEALSKLLQEKSSIFVIEHNESFKAQFENRIVAVRQNAVSRIVEEVGAEEEATQSDAPRKRPSKKKPARKTRRKNTPRRSPVRSRG